MKNKLPGSGQFLDLENATYLACCRLETNVIQIPSAGQFSYSLDVSGMNTPRPVS